MFIVSLHRSVLVVPEAIQTIKCFLPFFLCQVRKISFQSHESVFGKKCEHFHKRNALLRTPLLCANIIENY